MRDVVAGPDHRDGESLRFTCARTWVWVAALVVAYVVTGRLGLGLAYYQQNATLVWAPSGLAVAAVWLCGRRMALGVWLGALIVNLAIGSSPALAIIIAFGNTLEALAAAALARRMRIDPRLARIRDVVLMMVLLVVAATTIAATVGVAGLLVLGDLPRTHVTATWLIWWLGDAGGVLVVTPLVLAFVRRDAPATLLGGIRERLLLAAVIGVSALLAFGGKASTPWLGLPVALLPYPALTWAALRFGMRGATVATVLVICGAVIGTAAGTGPFQHENTHVAMATLWVFMATLGTSTMVLAASLEQRARADEERRAMALRLERSERLTSLGLLAGGVAHDFNNILTVITANASLARYAPASAAAADALEAIETAGRRAADLTAQLLAYAGRRPMQRAAVDLGAITTETVRLLGTTVPTTTTMLEEHAAALPRVNGDAAQLRHVILNLVVNAVESLDGKAGAVKVRTFVPGRHDRRPAELLAGDWVVLSVADTGRGMDETTRERVFEPFFTTKAGGRGLGMSAVQGIVRSHGGAIEISSTPGRGTEFRIWLPASHEALAAAPAASPSSSAPALAAHTRRAIVIDDEPAVREITRLLLEDIGWQVRAAASGDEGIALLEAECPDVVILDLTMPKRGGIAVLGDIRARHPDLPVVLMSGYSEDLVKGQRVPGVTFLAKPFGADELYERISATLGDDLVTRVRARGA